ncbi:MAG: transcription antitermination factor NusB [Armatimonadetes bacterium]|nr:transcription antitermination factor NusB [Armatimonadota bacterium]
MKKARRAARELALNVLYQWDAAKLPFEEALETALEFADLSPLKTEERIEEAKRYARLLAVGVKNNADELDARIARHAEGWSPERQPAVDRNILRIAIYEISHVDSVPPIVAVDEAVELAKKYSTAESGKFVNGVLAGYLKKEERIGGTTT